MRALLSIQCRRTSPAISIFMDDSAPFCTLPFVNDSAMIVTKKNQGGLHK